MTIEGSFSSVEPGFRPEARLNNVILEEIFVPTEPVEARSVEFRPVVIEAATEGVEEYKQKPVDVGGGDGVVSAGYDRLKRVARVSATAVATMGLAACASTGSSFSAELGVRATIGLVGWGIFSYALKDISKNRKFTRTAGFLGGLGFAIFPGVMIFPLIIAAIASSNRIIRRIENGPKIKEIEGKQTEITELIRAVQTGELSQIYRNLEKEKKRLK